MFAVNYSFVNTPISTKFMAFIVIAVKQTFNVIFSVIGKL